MRNKTPKIVNEFDKITKNKQITKTTFNEK